MKDGADLSDVNKDLQWSRKKGSFSSAEDCMTVVLPFLEQYYQI
jgi:hypothetical protein